MTVLSGMSVSPSKRSPVSLVQMSTGSVGCHDSQSGLVPASATSGGPEVKVPLSLSKVAR